MSMERGRFRSQGMSRRAVLCGAGLALAGCASTPSALQTYELSSPRDFGGRGGRGRGQLLIIEPKTIATLDTERIAVRQAGGAFAYLNDGAWADRLPRLLQTRIIQAFENANRLAGVGRPGDRLASDWQLLTEIRAFNLVVEGQTSAEVEVSVKLVNDRNGRILAAQVFGARTPASATEARAAVTAFDASLQVVLRDVVIWASLRV